VHSSFPLSSTMKRFAVLYLFVVISSSARTPESLAPQAIKSIINDYHAKTFHEVVIINFGLKFGPAEKTIDELLKLGTSTVPMKICRDVRKKPSEKYLLTKPSVLLFDSPENFNQTYARIIFQSGQLSHPHIVYILKATIKDIQVAANKKLTIDKTVFLVEETRHSISLATAFMFTQEACHTNQFKVINRYTRGRKKWEKLDFFVEKFKNFYGCTMKIEADLLMDELMPLYSTFASELNFTIEPVNQEIEATEEIIIFFAPAQDVMIPSITFYTTDIEFKKIYIPPGEIYGDFEKMLLPFDRSTWIAMGVMIAAGVLTIIAIMLRPRAIQTIIFGRNIGSPLMNFISILLNGDQPRTSRGNVSRILLIAFMFWCLVFR
jgi:hypothetical protein